MGGKCLKVIRLPCSCELKTRVKRLARSNGLTCSELIRLSIEAQLPECEAGKLPLWWACGALAGSFLGPPEVGAERIIKDAIASVWT